MVVPVIPTWLGWGLSLLTLAATLAAFGLATTAWVMARSGHVRARVMSNRTILVAALAVGVAACHALSIVGTIWMAAPGTLGSQADHQRWLSLSMAESVWNVGLAFVVNAAPAIVALVVRWTAAKRDQSDHEPASVGP